MPAPEREAQPWPLVPMRPPPKPASRPLRGYHPGPKGDGGKSTASPLGYTRRVIPAQGGALDAARPPCKESPVMQGQKAVIDALNKLLTGELTAMDLYMAQSRKYLDWGYQRLFERFNHEMDDERDHAGKLVERILYLEGEPDLTGRLPYVVGKDVKSMLKEALRLEIVVANSLNATMKLAVGQGDNGTRALLEGLLHDTEEDHILWIEGQLDQIEQMGIQNYLSQQLRP